jgi:hypothetical protein
MSRDLISVKVATLVAAGFERGPSQDIPRSWVPSLNSLYS